MQALNKQSRRLTVSGRLIGTQIIHIVWHIIRKRVLKFQRSTEIKKNPDRKL